MALKDPALVSYAVITRKTVIFALLLTLLLQALSSKQAVAAPEDAATQSTSPAAAERSSEDSLKDNGEKGKHAEGKKKETAEDVAPLDAWAPIKKEEESVSHTTTTLKPKADIVSEENALPEAETRYIYGVFFSQIIPNRHDRQLIESATKIRQKLIRKNRFAWEKLYLDRRGEPEAVICALNFRAFVNNSALYAPPSPTAEPSAEKGALNTENAKQEKAEKKPRPVKIARLAAKDFAAAVKRANCTLIAVQEVVGDNPKIAAANLYQYLSALKRETGKVWREIVGGGDGVRNAFILPKEMEALSAKIYPGVIDPEIGPPLVSDPFVLTVKVKGREGRRDRDIRVVNFNTAYHKAEPLITEKSLARATAIKDFLRSISREAVAGKRPLSVIVGELNEPAGGLIDLVISNKVGRSDFTDNCVIPDEEAKKDEANQEEAKKDETQESDAENKANAEAEAERVVPGLIKCKSFPKRPILLFNLTNRSPITTDKAENAKLPTQMIYLFQADLPYALKSPLGRARYLAKRTKIAEPQFFLADITLNW